MKSPITNKEMKLIKEKRSLNFRKESYEIVFHTYLCEDSAEKFTDTKLGELNTNQVYNKYREKHNIPFPDEIKQLREKYGLSQNAMSQVLGFGINSYRQYESGEIPSSSNAKLIHLADNPHNFIEMLKTCDSMDRKTISKHIIHLEKLISSTHENSIIDYFLGSNSSDIYSGYRNPNWDRFAEMVVFFSEKIQPYKTKMNKLLFYADFLNFKNYGYSISGMRYYAIPMGPVPNKYQSIYEYLNNNDKIEIEFIPIDINITGEQFKSKTSKPFNSSLFSENELEVLGSVVDRFKTTNTKEIIEMSHQEEAWIQNEKDKKAISYEYAFEME